MKHLLLALLFCAPLMALIDTSAEVGYRRDHIRWSISGNGADVLSELTYRNLNTAEIRGQAETNLLCWHLRLRGASGYLFSGTDQDDDYNFSGRREPFGFSTSRLRGMTNDVTADLGRSRSLGPLCLLARTGLEWHHIYLDSYDGFDRLENPPRPFPPGSDATYHTHWTGGYSSLELRLALPCNRLRLEGTYHYGAFIGRGNWRLRDHHFDQVAAAWGLGLEGSWRYRLCGPLWAVARLGGNYWSSSGAGWHHGRQGLRHAQWSNIRTSLGLACSI